MRPKTGSRSRFLFFLGLLALSRRPSQTDRRARSTPGAHQVRARRGAAAARGGAGAAGRVRAQGSRGGGGGRSHHRQRQGRSRAPRRRSQGQMEDFVARRTKMAEQKIAQAEAQALADVRSAAADAAVAAAEKILSAAAKGKVAGGSARSGHRGRQTKIQLSRRRGGSGDQARAVFRNRFGSFQMLPAPGAAQKIRFLCIIAHPPHCSSLLNRAKRYLHPALPRKVGLPLLGPNHRRDPWSSSIVTACLSTANRLRLRSSSGRCGGRRDGVRRRRRCAGFTAAGRPTSSPRSRKPPARRLPPDFPVFVAAETLRRLRARTAADRPRRPRADLDSRAEGGGLVLPVRSHSRPASKSPG